MAHLTVLGRPKASEKAAAEYLAQALDADWAIAANLQAGTFGRGSFQIDALIVGAAGVLICDFKNVERAACYLNHPWELPGQTPTNFYEKGTTQTYQIYDWVRDKVGRDVKRELQISHCVFFTKAGAQVEIDDSVIGDHILQKSQDLQRSVNFLLRRRRKSDPTLVSGIWSVVRNDDALNAVLRERGSDQPSADRPNETDTTSPSKQQHGAGEPLRSKSRLASTKDEVRSTNLSPEGQLTEKALADQDRVNGECIGGGQEDPVEQPDLQRDAMPGSSITKKPVISHEHIQVVHNPITAPPIIKDTKQDLESYFAAIRKTKWKYSPRLRIGGSGSSRTIQLTPFQALDYGERYSIVSPEGAVGSVILPRRKAVGDSIMRKDGKYTLEFIADEFFTPIGLDLETSLAYLTTQDELLLRGPWDDYITELPTTTKIVEIPRAGLNGYGWTDKGRLLYSFDPAHPLSVSTDFTRKYAQNDEDRKKQRRDARLVDMAIIAVLVLVILILYYFFD